MSMKKQTPNYLQSQKEKSLKLARKNIKVRQFLRLQLPLAVLE